MLVSGILFSCCLVVPNAMPLWVCVCLMEKAGVSGKVCSLVTVCAVVTAAMKSVNQDLVLEEEST